MKAPSQSVTALLAYPLSQTYVDKLNRHVEAEVTLLSLQELKSLGFYSLIKRLRQVKGRLLIPLEDPTSIALLPIYQVLSLFTRAQSYEVVDSHLQRTYFTKLQSITAGFRLLFATLANFIAIFRTKLTLLRAPLKLACCKVQPQGDILFINANLWFGVKAGGSIGHIAGVCNALAEQGYRVTYAAVEPNQC